MLLTAGCMVAEVVGGVIAGSLALIADAAHMPTDTAAPAWAAFRVGHWPQAPGAAMATTGFRRSRLSSTASA
jgi:cobalt-zinc-cadmium efflux system protein